MVILYSCSLQGQVFRLDSYLELHYHTFLIEISTNALPIEKFVFYLKQDRIFLIEFCSFLQAVKQKLQNCQDMT
jgi:thiaminase